MERSVPKMLCHEGCPHSQEAIDAIPEETIGVVMEAFNRACMITHQPGGFTDDEFYEAMSLYKLAANGGYNGAENNFSMWLVRLVGTLQHCNKDKEPQRMPNDPIGFFCRYLKHSTPDDCLVYFMLWRLVMDKPSFGYAVYRQNPHFFEQFASTLKRICLSCNHLYPVILLEQSHLDDDPFDFLAYKSFRILIDERDEDKCVNKTVESWKLGFVGRYGKRGSEQWKESQVRNAAKSGSLVMCM